VIAAGTDPLAHHRVVGYFAKRAFDHGARIVVIDDEENGLNAYAHLVCSTAQAGEAIALAKNAEKPVVIYGPELNDALKKALLTLRDSAVFLGLEPGPNARGAAAAGLAPAAPMPADVLFLLAGEASDDTAAELSAFVDGGFTVVQASRQSPLLDKADVVLPAPIWAEQSGHVTSLEGITAAVEPAVAMPAGVRSEAEVLKTLAGML